MNRRHFLMFAGASLAALALGERLEQALKRRRLAALPAPAPSRTPATPPAAVSPSPPPAPEAPLLLYDPHCLLYQGPKVGAADERPERVAKLVARLEAEGLSLGTGDLAPAPPEALARVHTPAYLAWIKRARALPQTEFVPGAAPSPAPPRPTRLRPYDAAALAAGGALAATESVMTGRARRAFAVVRPSGHHAGPSRAMGFCIFNNAAVAARHAQAALGAERVLIVDWDVHHGNGTQAIFEADPSVLFFSVHQEGLYPKRSGRIRELGRGAGRGTTLNVPLPKGATDADYLAVFDDLLAPAAAAFRPDLVIVSAGQDALEADRASQMRLSPAGFGALAGRVLALAERHAEGRAVFLLEGGYAPEPCAEAAWRIVQAISGAPGAAPQSPAVPRPAVAKRIAAVRRAHEAFAPLARLGARA